MAGQPAHSALNRTDGKALDIAEKNRALADPEFRRLFLACDEAMEWDPEDPRLPELATRIAAWARQQPE